MKALVFVPTNKMLMSLENICNNVERYSKEVIVHDYNDIIDKMIAEQKSESEQETLEQCLLM